MSARRLATAARCAALAVVLLATLAAHGALAAAASDSTSADSSAARPARDSSGGTPAPADSLPSADARSVLRSIPEPLTPDEEGTPPESLATAPPAYAEPDTAAADTSGVPIPAKTTPLGDVPGGAAASVFSDSVASATPGSGKPLAAPAGAAPSAAPATGGTSAPPAGGAPTAPAGGTVPAPPDTAGAAAKPDTCWRLQIAAPLARPEAEAKREAAESQLLVKFTIDVEKGRNKVRSLDCLSREMGEALKARALLSGFEGAFLIRYGRDGKPIPMHPAAKPPAKSSTGRKSSGAKPASKSSAARR